MDENLARLIQYGLNCDLPADVAAAWLEFVADPAVIRAMHRYGMREKRRLRIVKGEGSPPGSISGGQEFESRV